MITSGECASARSHLSHFRTPGKSGQRDGWGVRGNLSRFRLDPRQIIITTNERVTDKGRRRRRHTASRLATQCACLALCVGKCDNFKVCAAKKKAKPFSSSRHKSTSSDVQLIQWAEPVFSQDPERRHIKKRIVRS